MDTMLNLLMILVPGLPLAAAVLVAVLGPRVLRARSHWPVVLALSASALCSLALLWHTARQPAGYERVVSCWTWALMEGAYQPAADPAAGLLSARGAACDLAIDVALRLDSLTAIMLAMVTFVSLVVAVYSVGYMRADRGYWRFFAYIGLFVFSMTMLVSVSNFLLLFVFWEGVGLCSYLLIGFWYEKPSAAAAGLKAFLVNRVGDFGFMLGVFLIWTTYGTLNYHDTPRVLPAALAGDASASVSAAPGAGSIPGVLSVYRTTSLGHVGGATGLAICLLLLLGACGKSAQFPLHVWLPDAMEGPTPVSALIHAATMVTAGVYMIARCTPLFMAAPAAQLAVAGIGTFTALLAALIALTQFDLKRVLAYSTISQLGYMFLGLGTGTLAGISAGMFHLFTHAFFKALLFLGAGSVMHAMGNVVDMRRFGGLRRVMPRTFGTFLVGCLALSGIAPLAGFWSKDAILAAVQGKAHLSGQGAGFASVYELLYYTALATAFLTSVYTFRMLYLTFFGERRVPAEAGGHARESPGVIVWPLVVLAAGAAVVGLLLDQSYLGGGHPFAALLARTPSLAGPVARTEALGAFHFGVAAMSMLVASAGIGLASYLYLGDRRLLARLRSLLDFEWMAAASEQARLVRLTHGPWMQGIYRAAAAVRLRWLVHALVSVVLLTALVLSTPLLAGRFLSPYHLAYGKFFLDELYHVLIVLPLRALAWLCGVVDDWVVDALVNALGRVPLYVGALFRSLQTGLVQFYALGMIAGALVLVVVLLAAVDGQLSVRVVEWLAAVLAAGGNR